MPKCRVQRHSVTQPLDKPYRFIPLTQGQNAIVDVEDFEWLNEWNWCAAWMKNINGFYACRFTEAEGTIWLHRFILRAKIGEQIDHRNHDTLDCRKFNLRNCSHAQNGKNRRISKNNTSGFKGVHRNNSGGRPWRARIRVGEKFLSLGFYDSPEEAAKAYDKAASTFHGEFAHLNYPPRVL